LACLQWHNPAFAPKTKTSRIDLDRTRRPALEGTSGEDGFGNKLMARVVEQIGGSITRDWSNEGVVVTLRISKAWLGA
jgi:two-component sensor histidine kinase